METNQRTKASPIFRQSSLNRIASPEQTDDYVRLPAPNLWLIAVAAALLAAGALVWLTLGV